MKPNNPISIKSHRTPDHPELSRILSAAVINSQFRQMLLQNPLHAVSSGYQGEGFSLDPIEKQAIAAINVTTLAEFAAQLANL